MLFLGAGVLALSSMLNHRKIDFLRAVVMFGVCAVLVFDSVYLSRHYIKTADSDALLGENPAVSYLNANLGRGRVFVLEQQDPMFNQWLTYLFPYHGVTAFNVTQMPRILSNEASELGASNKMVHAR